MRGGFLAVVIPLILLAAPTRAQDYFPLDELIIREYLTVGESETSSRLFSGTFLVNGVSASVLHHFGGLDQGLQQYWSKNGEGDTLFHGFLTGTGFQLTWTPPFVMIDLPLSVGKTWDQVSQASDGSSISLHFEVTSFGSITVPAGTYDGVSIQMTQQLPSKSEPSSIVGEFGLFGTTAATDVWQYTDQTGLLRWQGPTRADELVGIQVVGIESTSWTGIRALYR